MNSILLLNHLNRVVVIAAGVSSCSYIFDSSDTSGPDGAGVAATFDKTSHKMKDFIEQDARATTGNSSVDSGNAASLLSGALSLALCCILWLNFCTFMHLNLHMCCLTWRMVRYTENFPVWDPASTTSGECDVLLYGFEYRLVFMLVTGINTMERSSQVRYMTACD